MKPRLVIFSGAGLSAESGISTFRDSDGTWENHDIMEVCSLPSFEKNYEAVHRFYNSRRIELKDVEPNDAHKFIAEMQKQYGSDRVINITANVDDLLERAGCTDVMHIHGFLTDLVTDYSTTRPKVIPFGYNEYDYKKDYVQSEYEINAKPSVVFFGENAPLYDDMDKILRNLNAYDTFIMVGSTLEVNPVHFYCYGSTAYSVVINPSIVHGGTSALDQAADSVHLALTETATSGFRKIENLLHSRMTALD